MADAAGGTAGAATNAATGGADAGTNTRRRRGPQEEQQVIDELAQETKRTSLLDRLETQVKDRAHVSRVLFGFNVPDDKKLQKQVDDDFTTWRGKQEHKFDLSGVMLFTVQGALVFMEGPTEMIFGAVAHFHGLAMDSVPPSLPRQALIGPLRILHFTELHGVRASAGWCSWNHPGKLQGSTQVQMDDDSAAAACFKTYEKFLKWCLRVSGGFGEDDRPAPSSLQTAYKKAEDLVPGVDEVYALTSKAAAEFFFTFPEFEKTFISPFQLVLHSELLWPMSPALVY